MFIFLVNTDKVTIKNYNWYEKEGRTVPLMPFIQIFDFYFESTSFVEHPVQHKI